MDQTNDRDYTLILFDLSLTSWPERRTNCVDMSAPMTTMAEAFCNELVHPRAGHGPNESDPSHWIARYQLS